MIRHHRDGTYRNNTPTRTAGGAGTCSGGALKITPGDVSRPVRWLYGSGSLFKPMESGNCGDGCPQDSSPSNNPKGRSEPYIRIVSGDMTSTEAHETLPNVPNGEEEGRLNGVNDGCYAVADRVTTEVNFCFGVVRENTPTQNDDEGCNVVDRDHEVVIGLRTAESEILLRWFPYFTIDPYLQTLPMRKRISVLFNLLTKTVADLSIGSALQLIVRGLFSLIGRITSDDPEKLDSLPLENLTLLDHPEVVKLLTLIRVKYLIYARAISLRVPRTSQTGCNWIITGVRMDASSDMLSNLDELNQMSVRGAVR